MFSQEHLLGRRSAEWWTGPRPAPGLCPGVDAEGRIHALPQLLLEGISRQDLIDYFNNGWALTETLFSALQGEAAFHKTPKHGLRHPLIFYYGHPAVLYVNKLRVAGLLSAGVNASIESLLEVGVDEMSWDDLSKNERPWPSVAEIHAYRKEVYGIILDLLRTHPALDPREQAISQRSPAWAMVMGFEHERIHLETSSVLMRELPLEYLREPAEWPPLSPASSRAAAPATLIRLEGGMAKIGKPEAFPSFGWDNEYGRRNQEVAPFDVSSRLVSNGDFLEFVKAGGYFERSYWSDKGWGWRSFRNTKYPTFWVPRGPEGLREYSLRSTFRLLDFQSHWPALVNFHEAKAFAKWMSSGHAEVRSDLQTSANGGASRPAGARVAAGEFRLLSEAEHHLLRAFADDNGAARAWNWQLKSGGETAVDQYSSNGVCDVFGNAWQWCEDECNPLPGFRAHPYYEDFSTPCFDGKHHMMLGGSFVSAGDEASRYARFHFRPHFFQHAGFRLARSVDPLSPSSAVRLSQAPESLASDYESKALLAQYLLLHFGEERDLFPFDPRPTEALRFPQRCAEILLSESRQRGLPMGSAMDVGCAVGGACFTLSQGFERVVGVDYSASFVQAAKELAAGAELPFEFKRQGDLVKRATVRAPADSRPERVDFVVGDASKLDPALREFDAVLLANLLCRLSKPADCLRAMGGERSVVKVGGLLLLVSPYSWLEAHTPRSEWLGAKAREGRELESSDEIRKVLGPHFRLLKEDNFPLLIREHERKYQYIVSHLMLWQRFS